MTSFAARDLTPFFYPSSVSVIGASDDRQRIRGRLLDQLVRGGFDGDIFPVNPMREVVQGIACYPSPRAIPRRIDLALVAVPAEQVEQTLIECASAGVRAAMIYTSGFAEAGLSAARMQERIGDIASASGMVVGGPNVVGFMNVRHKLVATFSPAIDFDVLASQQSGDRRDRIAIISQSGGLGFALFNRGLRRGLNFSHVINSGNEATLDAAELAGFMVEDPETRVVLMFLETIRDGLRFRLVAERARELGKLLVVAKIGRSEAAARAAASHTASMTGSDAVYESVFADAGIIRAEDQDEMLDYAAAALSGQPLQGSRIGIVTISGGVGGWLADTLSGAGFEVPEFSTGLQERIRRFLPNYGAASNPIDTTAQAIENDLRVRSVEALCESDEVDAVIVVSSLAADNRLPLEKDELASLIARSGKPVLFYTYPLPSDAAVATLSEIGVPCYTSLRGVARGLEALRHVAKKKRAPTLRSESPRGARERAVAILDGAERILCEYEANDILRAYGIQIAADRLATSSAEALQAARELGYPLALKIQSPDLPHKTEAGAIALGIADDAELERQWERVHANARAKAPDARIRGALLQPMAKPGTEMIVGVLNDDLFGPQIVVGLGGVLVEILRDTAMAPAPLDPGGARMLLDRLRGSPLLAGFRGQPSRDAAALADLMARVSTMAVDLADRLEQIDLNPVIVHDTGNGLSVVDALMVKKGRQT